MDFDKTDYTIHNETDNIIQDENCTLHNENNINECSDNSEFAIMPTEETNTYVDVSNIRDYSFDKPDIENVLDQSIINDNVLHSDIESEIADKLLFETFIQCENEIIDEDNIQYNDNLDCYEVINGIIHLSPDIEMEYMCNNENGDEYGDEHGDEDYDEHDDEQVDENETKEFCDIIKDKTITNILIHIIYWYSYIYNIIYKTAKCIYENNPIISNITDYTHYGIERIVANIENKLIEPFDKTWFCLSYVINDNDQPIILLRNPNTHINSNPSSDVAKLCYNEIYYYNDVLTENPNHNILFKYMELFDNTKTIDYLNISFILMMKIENKYVVRCKNIMDNLSILTVPSSIRFLSVIYNHPEMDESIVFELTPEMYMVGNELFSFAFVYRMLKYQSLPYKIDYNYEIVIIDNMINTITISSNQYIRLCDDKYYVVE